MKNLIQRLGAVVKGVVTGFDRIVFKGMIRPLSYCEGAMNFCRRYSILFKDYKEWMLAQTNALVETAEAYARNHCGQGIVHLESWREDKEEKARERQKVAGIESGLIGVWSCQESGRSYRSRYCPDRGYPLLRGCAPRCKHLYFYFDHERYGWMHIRLQTWFPYPVQISLNGREWLRRRLEAEGVGFVRRGNKFFHIDDYALAQAILDEQLHTPWPQALSELIDEVFPTRSDTLGSGLDYYWTLWQSEWATDLILDAPGSMGPVLENMLRHAFATGVSCRVLRYLDRPVTKDGRPYRNQRHEVFSRLKDFQEGLRVRHWVDSNSVKAYNEQNVLRIETTINDPGMFFVWRRAEGESPDAPKKRRPLCKGVSHAALRAEISEEINHRFAQTLASVGDETPWRETSRM